MFYKWSLTQRNTIVTKKKYFDYMFKCEVHSKVSTNAWHIIGA